MIDFVGLARAARRRAGAFSLGMRQRLGIAAALLGDPRILILDEPTIGLDPDGIQWMRETLRGLAAEGRTVFMSSHLMGELEGTADHVIVIGKGRLLADVSVDELISTVSGDRVEVRTPDAATAMSVLANAGATVISNGRDHVAVEGMPAARVAELLTSQHVRQIGLAGVVFAQIAAVVAGASLVTSEFASGMIRTTLTATQGRLRVLGAKAVVLSLVTFPLGLSTSAAGFVIAQSLLHDRGYVPPAYPPVSLTDPGAARAVVGTGLLLTAYSLIALGIGTVLRHSGATIATGIGLLFLPVLFLGAFPERIATRVAQLTPLAGMAIQSTTDRMLAPFDGRLGMPIGPWHGLGVAFAWALGVLAVGHVLLRVRDA